MPPIVVDTSGPAAKASRYVDIFGVCWKETTDAPSPRVRCAATGMLLSAVNPAGTPSTVREKRALRAGSSKQGKALRAYVASNCVASIVTLWAASLRKTLV